MAMSVSVALGMSETIRRAGCSSRTAFPASSVSSIGELPVASVRSLRDQPLAQVRTRARTTVATTMNDRHAAPVRWNPISLLTRPPKNTNPSWSRREKGRGE